MTEEPSLIIERELYIQARPEVVFRFLTEREYLLRWQGVDAALDLQPGGDYRIQLNGGDVIAGRFLEIAPPSRLVYTWGWESGGVPDIAPGSSTVEVTLTPEREGTRLRLVHSGLPAVREIVDRHRDGWSYYLMRLAIAAGGGQPPEDGHARGMDVISDATQRFDEQYGAKPPRR